jgi:DNA-binding transcriptional regulator YhcF (GntR family)
LAFSRDSPKSDELKYTNELEQDGMIKIEKVRGGYLAHVTSPHVQEEWKNPTPLSRSELVKELRSRGVHTTDISDAFYEADPNWLQNPD